MGFLSFLRFSFVLWPGSTLLFSSSVFIFVFSSFTVTRFFEWGLILRLRVFAGFSYPLTLAEFLFAKWELSLPLSVWHGLRLFPCQWDRDLNSRGRGKGTKKEEREKCKEKNEDEKIELKKVRSWEWFNAFYIYNVVVFCRLLFVFLQFDHNTRCGREQDTKEVRSCFDRIKRRRSDFYHWEEIV